MKMMGLPLDDRSFLRPEQTFGAVNESQDANKSLVEQSAQGCQVINKCLDYDNRYPDVASLLRTPYSNDYLGLPSSFVNASLVQIVGGVTFPNFLFQQFEKAETKCSCGIFSAIEMGWIAIDHTLYVWDYNHSSRLSTVCTLDGLISTVELCTPPKFLKDLEDISKMLVIATTADIQVVAVRQSGADVIKFDVLPEYSVALEDSFILQFVSTRKGRTFFVTAGGDVMELVLRQQSRWFSSEKSAEKVSRSVRTPWWLPTVLANWANSDFVIQLFVDDFRNLIYALTKENHILVFELGADGTDYIRRKAPFKSILADYASVTAKTLDYSLPSFRAAISSIFPMNPKESRTIDFVAVSVSGVRFYFKCSGESIELCHIREAPPLKGAKSLACSAIASQGCQLYQSGAFVHTLAVSDESDALVVTIQESGTVRLRIGDQPMIYELHSAVQLGSKVWGIVPVRSPSSANYFEDLVPHEFLVLTNIGVNKAIISRPNDFVRQAAQDFAACRSIVAPVSAFGVSSHMQPSISSFGGADELVWSELIALYSPRELSTILYGIGSGNEKYMPTVELAFGNSRFQSGRSYDSKINKKARQLLTLKIFDVADTLTASHTSAHMVPPVAARVAGLYTYGSRLLASVWNRCLFENVSAEKRDETGLLLQVPLSRDELVWVQNGLRELLKLMADCPGLLEMEALSENTQEQDRSHREYTERLSFKVAIEVSLQLSILLSTILEFKFLVLLHQTTTTAERQLLQQVTFGGFVCVADDQKRVLQSVNKLILNAVSSLSSPETSQNLADMLHSQCPLFFNQGESELFKALNDLTQSEKSPLGSKQKLQRALIRFKEAVGALTMDYLENVVKRFSALGAFSYAMELTSACLQQTSQESVHEYLFNLICQQFVLLLKLEAEATDSESGAVAVGPLAKSLSLQELIEERRSSVKALLKSPDPHFHFQLYGFLYKQKQTNILLEIEHPFLEKWLIERQTSEVGVADLWWKYAVRRRQYSKAAKIQFSLALTDLFALDLERRMQYLASALANLKSVAYSGDSREEELANDVRWARDRAQIQLLALQALQDLFATAQSREEQHRLNTVAEKLNGEIMDISELHNTVVKPFGLYAIALRIYKATKYDDVALILDSWKHIIENAAASRSSLDPWLAVANQVEQLVGDFYSDLTIVPLADIISLLETFALSTQPKPPVGWAINALISARVPAIVLREVYEQLLNNRLHPWSDPANSAHLERQLTHLSSHLNAEH